MWFYSGVEVTWSWWRREWIYMQSEGRGCRNRDRLRIEWVLLKTRMIKWSYHVLHQKFVRKTLVKLTTTRRQILSLLHWWSDPSVFFRQDKHSSSCTKASESVLCLRVDHKWRHEYFDIVLPSFNLLKSSGGNISSSQNC